ncbi:hypothetical protein NC652_015124 [Populus alba x Populus x berolinensis]|nr:hypothetical protein NC652_015124 [Populus alba x Populus x berolinensis]
MNLKKSSCNGFRKGTEPIYIGFGSMPLDDPKNTMDIILEALKDTGQRRNSLIKLWKYLTVSSFLKDCPHDCGCFPLNVLLWCKIR